MERSPSVSTPVSLAGAGLRPGVEVLLGVGASERDVGVLDLDTGVVDFSFWKTQFLFKVILIIKVLNTGLSCCRYLQQKGLRDKKKIIIQD